MDTRLGVLLWNQATSWRDQEAVAVRADSLGYDHLWAWDHLYAIFGDPYQPIFEGYTTLAAWAKVTSQARLGLLVGANTFRNPALVAKMLTTIDHISEGRAITGLGGAWFDLEHQAAGIEFGTGFGQRLDWFDESIGALRGMLDGETVSSPAGGRYALDEMRLLPPPIQAHLPVMIGGSGERKTLRTVAKYADMWNAMGTVDVMRHKVEVLQRHCDDVGRDFATIEMTLGCKPIIRDTADEARRVLEAQMAHNRTPMSEIADDDTFWSGTAEQIAGQMRQYKALGFHTFIAELPAPYDDETLERWIGEVRPMLDAG
jgi:alkanesulfonate monooxygenase SsuD/methylene tetrahydromethanopterin reductase-like flavin-dependent oxidoreductase (luciferase family)